MPTQYFQQYQIKTEAPPSSTIALISKFESSFHQPWSLPVWPKRGFREQRQQFFAYWPAVILVPDVTLVMRALSVETSDTAAFLIKLPDVSLAMRAIEPPNDAAAEFLMTVSDELPTTPDLTSVNVSIEEVDSSGVATSIKGDNA